MEQIIKDTTANPAPLGLFGFGMTTILLNIHNAGFYEVNSMIMGMGIFFGGTQQVIAGIMEWKKGNGFGMSAFTSYGFFWLSLVAIWILPTIGITKYDGTPMNIHPDGASMGCYLGLWGLFTLAFFIGTLNGNTIGKLIFGSLVILFALLSAASFTGSESIHTFAGYEGILCGFFAFYEGAAIVINEKLGRKVLPL
ncbi:acetate uptake transporter [Flavobacterium sp.]|uniref:acetate uptake transporter n=1 Tax=Flavobacterium sp. TaxID=239 RepID=UPI001B4A7734|nr:acetate uptake transporter [Flavobacterium sp.]MBP6183284.1 acetate uptake transporter [Flavobacterium sp.]